MAKGIKLTPEMMKDIYDMYMKVQKGEMIANDGEKEIEKNMA